MKHHQQLEEVEDLVAEATGANRDKLTASTRLGHDLGVDGDDAEDLMQTFAQRFQVDISDFDFNLHFGPEAASNPFLYLYWRLFKPSELEMVPITIGDLAEAATKKKWHTPEHKRF